MIKLLRLVVVHENGTAEHIDFSTPSPARNSTIDFILNEKVDLGDGLRLKGFQISPIFDNRISFYTMPVADLHSVLCDECHEAEAVMELEPIVDDDERAHGPRRPDMDVCTECADKLLATGKWEVA